MQKLPKMIQDLNEKLLPLSWRLECRTGTERPWVLVRYSVDPSLDSVLAFTLLEFALAHAEDYLLPREIHHDHDINFLDHFEDEHTLED